MAKAKKAKSNVIPFPLPAKKKEPGQKFTPFTEQERLILRQLMTDEMKERRKTKRAAHMIWLTAVVTDEAFLSIRKIITKTQGWFEYLNLPGQGEINPL